MRARRLLGLVFAALLASPAGAVDQLPYLGTVALVAADYCPTNSLPADGRELQAREQQALYALLLNCFGGEEQKTFKLPDLSGKAPKGMLYCICVSGIWPPKD